MGLSVLFIFAALDPHFLKFKVERIVYLRIVAKLFDKSLNFLGEIWR